MLHDPAGEMRASNLTKDAFIEPSSLWTCWLVD
jgi:hypothetical protein